MFGGWYVAIASTLLPDGFAGRCVYVKGRQFINVWAVCWTVHGIVIGLFHCSKKTLMEKALRRRCVVLCCVQQSVLFVHIPFYLRNCKQIMEFFYVQRVTAGVMKVAVCMPSM